MRRNYCDVCGEDLEYRQNVVSDRLRDDVLLRGPNGTTRVKVEILCGIDQTWNDGDLCRQCLIRAVNQLWGPEPAAEAASVKASTSAQEGNDG